jgi:hypothetical protein
MQPKVVASIVAGTFLVFVTAIVASGSGWNPSKISWDFTNSGQFGDSFGFLSSFMAAAAAFAAWGAYRLQHQEIDQLRASEVASRQLAEKRDFEQTFFNLLELLRGVVKEIDVLGDDGNQLHGRDAMAHFLYEAESAAALEPANPNADEQAFTALYRSHREDLAHYFRLFYHIVKFISESPVQPKKIYVRLVRATLSNSEMVLIALDCMYGGGKLKLRPLIEEYELLHNISQPAIDRWRMSDFLGPQAFGDRRMSASAQL